MARAGFVGGAAYSVIWFGIVVGLGVVGTAALPNAQPDDAFMGLAAKFLPHGLLGLLVVAIIAVIMSSQESVLNAGAVSFTRDIIDALRPGAMADGGRLWVARIATFVIGLVAALFAIWAPSIIDGLLIIYSLWAPSVLPILVLALVFKSPPRAAGTPAMIAGAVTSLVWQFALHEPAQIPAVIAGLAANLLVFGLFTITAKRG